MERLKISDDSVLKHCNYRYECSSCKKSVKYFCYFCHKCSPFLEGKIPVVDLAFSVDVIMHEGETEGKSTAVHAKLLASSQVKIYSHLAELPLYDNDNSVFLLYPSQHSIPITNLAPNVVKKIIVIDGTWAQAKKIVKLPAIAHLPKISFEPRHTLFWRYQPLGPSYLSTIEAIYYCCRDYMEAQRGSYHGQVDDLLWFFKFFYEIIQASYKSNLERTFNSRHSKDYIKY